MQTLKRILKSLGLLALAALAAGFIYERWSSTADRKRLPPIGRMVEVGGRALHIHCVGTGAPTVVLNAGGNAPGYEWAVIQPELARFTRVCAWDRPGTGWSDSPSYRWLCQDIARDLREALRAADESPAFVLVGASFGGHIARVFNGLYPNETAGAVLVDASHEEEGQRAPAFMLGSSSPHWARYPLYLLGRASVTFGLTRLTTGDHVRTPEGPGWTLEQQAVIAQLGKRPRNFADGLFTDENEAQVRAAGSFGDKPLLVLTAGRPHPMPPEFEREAAAYHQIWMHELQPGLARLSTRGRQRIIEDAPHDIGNARPQVVIEAVREIVTEVRNR